MARLATFRRSTLLVLLQMLSRRPPAADCHAPSTDVAAEHSDVDISFQPEHIAVMRKPQHSGPGAHEVRIRISGLQEGVRYRAEVGVENDDENRAADFHLFFWGERSDSGVGARDAELLLAQPGLVSTAATSAMLVVWVFNVAQDEFLVGYRRKRLAVASVASADGSADREESPRTQSGSAAEEEEEKQEEQQKLAHVQEKISASADIPIFLLGLKEVPNDQIDGVHDEDVPVSIGAVRGEDAEHGGRPTVGRPFRLEIKITGLTEGAPYVILINMHLGASKDRRSKHVLVAEGYRGIVRFVLPAPSTAAGYAIFVRLYMARCVNEAGEATGPCGNRPLVFDKDLDLVAILRQGLEIHGQGAADDDSEGGSGKGYPEQIYSKMCVPSNQDMLDMQESRPEIPRVAADRSSEPHQRAASLCQESVVCRLAAASNDITMQARKSLPARGNKEWGRSESGRRRKQGSQAADTLILYVSSPSEAGIGMWEDNLDFFLAQGLVSNPRYQIVLVMNHRRELAYARRAKLDALASWAGNFEWHSFDGSRDTDAWRAVFNGQLMSTLGFDLARIRRFLLLNSSVRGPFVPPFFTMPWPEAFFSLLSEDKVLAGMTVNCMCALIKPDSQPCRFDCSYDPGPAQMIHVPTMLLAFEREPMFDLVNETLFGGDCYWVERQISQRALGQRKNLAVAAAFGADVDFRDGQQVQHVCTDELHSLLWLPPRDRDSLHSHFPHWGSAHYGLAYHPIEQLFVKMNRLNPGSTLHLDIFTELSLRGSPWTAPIDLICCQDSGSGHGDLDSGSGHGDLGCNSRAHDKDVDALARPLPDRPKDVGGGVGEWDSRHHSRKGQVQQGKVEPEMNLGEFDCSSLVHVARHEDECTGEERCRTSQVCLLASNFSRVARKGAAVGARKGAAAAPEPTSPINDKSGLDSRLDGRPLRASQLPAAAHGARGQQLPDTLVVYSADACCSSQSALEDSLSFFLAQGLVRHVRYHFVIVLQTQSGDESMHACWKPKLDAIARWRRNVEWHWLEGGVDGCEACNDRVAFRAVLTGEQDPDRLRLNLSIAVKEIDRFILVSSALRGPFVPTYYLQPWPEVFLSMLSERTVVAGRVFECDFDHPESTKEQAHQEAAATTPDDKRPQGRGGSLWQHPFRHGRIDSALAAFSRREALGLVIAALESPGHAGTPTCRHKSNNKSGSVQGGNCSSGGGGGGGGGLWATTLTQTVLLSGKNLAVLASLWKGVDFQDPAAVTSTCSLARRRGAPPAESISQPRPFETDAGAGQVLASDKQAGAQGSGLLHAYEPYAGTRMHPFEAIFVKAHPEYADTLARLERIVLSSKIWWVPLCALCPAQHSRLKEDSTRASEDGNSDSGRAW